MYYLLTQPKPGDHLCYPFRVLYFGTAYHHGIYCGDITYKNRHYKDVVIHFDATKRVKGQIRGLAYKKFAKHHRMEFIEYEEGTCFAPEVVIKRAIHGLGNTDYNPLINNCEHFARWCKTGRSTSEQVDNTLGGLFLFG